MPVPIQPHPRRSGAITLGDLRGRLELLRVACSKCNRAGQYLLAKLIERYGSDMGLPEWKDQLTFDCPRQAKPAAWEVCGAHFPDLPAVMAAERRPARGHPVAVVAGIG